MAAEIVLATRFGPESDAPAAVAADLARELGGRVTLLYVVNIETMTAVAPEAGVDPGAEAGRQREAAERELVEFGRSRFGDVPHRVVLEQGDVAEAVARVAAEVGARFLVVGTRGRGQLARLILGDTVQNILQQTPCPVIVVPLRDDGSA